MSWQTWARRAIVADIATVILNAWPTYCVQNIHVDIQKVEVIKFPALQQVEIVPSNPETTENGKRKQQTIEAGPTQATSPEARTAEDRACAERSNQSGKTGQPIVENPEMSESKKPAQSEKKAKPPEPAPEKPEAPNITRVRADQPVGDPRRRVGAEGSREHAVGRSGRDRTGDGALRRRRGDLCDRGDDPRREDGAPRRHRRRMPVPGVAAGPLCERREPDGARRR